MALQLLWQAGMHLVCKKKLRTDLTLRGNTWADDTDGSILLQEVDLPIISRKQCNQAYRTIDIDLPKISKNMVCAGYTKDGHYENEKSPCIGDSGGPLINAGSDVVVGVVSWGLLGCGRDGAPTVFARVGSLRSFIDKHLEASASAHS